ncbi:MAG: energy transducer TonB [Thermodesulfobacteriota bacterium]
MALRTRRRSILRTAVILSLAVHVAALAGFQKAFPHFIVTVHNQTYHLELIRPEADDLDDNRSGQHEEASLDEEPPPPAEEPLEDTISLNTKDRRYVDYAGTIKNRLLEHWSYPSEAREMLIEGRLLVMFTLARDGAMQSIQILDSSGRELLDQEACRAVRSASPFPPFPEQIRVQRLNIRAVFDYRLTSR